MKSQWFETAYDGFGIVGLRNEVMEIAVVPALGAKVSSVRNLRTGREWMARPAGGKLFANAPDDYFVKSTAIGLDECLPTVRPCMMDERKLVDHGEVWNAPWQLDQPALSSGIVRTQVQLKALPFLFERSIRLDGNALLFSYRLTNTGTVPEKYLWAMHPLITLLEDDRIVLPDEVKTVTALRRRPDEIRIQEWSWPSPHPGDDLSKMELGVAHTAHAAGRGAKFYVRTAGPLWAGITNARTGDSLRIEAVDGVPLIAIWINRGVWRGEHNLAIEPTNALADGPTDWTGDWQTAGLLQAGAVREWAVRIVVA